MTKTLGTRYGIQITRPWNKDMYAHNEEVAEVMKKNLKAALDEVEDVDDRDKLCELAKIISGCGYSEDYTIGEIWERTSYDLEHCVENWWLNQEYPYAVKKGFVPELEKEMIGYSK